MLKPRGTGRNVREAFIIDPDEADQYCVYLHEIHDFETGEFTCIYAGVCQIRDVMSAPDARANSEWIEIMNAPTRPILKTSIVFICESPLTAQDKRRELRHSLRPICNIKGMSVTRNRRQMVECINTGKRYNSASDAARDTGVSQGNLSNHLSGKAGYRTVKGLEFRRVVE
jgi:hypothetical protein